ncbi:hypothetical protein QQG09_03215 [Melissococcus plutonius]|uniref:Uncharacterized protein n=1 Tax=Melissococcus plutonius TaxID=33970 RepID=A0A2Z5Y1U8_9ENTE|nr:hypothetical protein [Melissococcus plutonius]AIM25864.1 hypothetical protein MEPL_c013070 [Melissococcus plutonius S1]KMT23831.1 hypothetical protein MEPL2_3c00290 [Melissococcus plutonius]KMT24354.1 hypothetical protein MEPL3_6c00290 [Melissococcus plutonius]KMT25927.1 hypothetical protein MEPL1_6c00290 [Melissococcus plutonius]KMT28478.1 hypothetical protein MEPL4_5c00290 [Melissococcus plutonius]
MHQTYIDIIIDAIIEQYENEENFYQEYLQLTKKEWDCWKKGQGKLSNEAMQKVKNIFTDYEWMLVQKILRQTILFPEKRNTALSDYKWLKTTIAKKWLQSGSAVAELITLKEDKEKKIQSFIDLKVTISYDVWGFDDIVTFKLPSILQPQLEGGTNIQLLDWVNEKLTETYVAGNDY